MEQPPDAPAIALRGVTKRYPGAAGEAVSDLTLDVPSGRIVALVGPSGCGKTTTLKMINRLIEPTDGTIEVLGADQRATPAHELRRRIGYVIQHVGLLPHRLVRRNIAVVPELLGWDSERIDARVAEMVDLVGLERELLDRYPSELSGGQQQRVGVARALAADPPILLMDEPFSAVDPIVRERLGDELLALQAKLRKTIVFVTHDVDEAIRLGDRVAVLQVGGVLAQYDTPSELLRAPASEFVATFLGRERGLRRLSLMTVADVEPQRGPVVEQTDTAHTAAAANGEHGGTWVAVTSSGRLLGWVDGDDVAAAAPGAAVSELALHDFVALVTPATPLREALDVIVRSRSRIAAVIERADDPVLLGFVTVDEVAGGLET